MTTEKVKRLRFMLIVDVPYGENPCVFADTIQTALEECEIDLGVVDIEPCDATEDQWIEYCYHLGMVMP